MVHDPTDERDRIEAWVRRHQVRTWRYARLRGCAPHLADDLVQDVLLAAVHKGVHREADERAAPWLRVALDHALAMHRRSEGRRERHVAAAVAERALQLGAPDDDGTAWLLALRACLADLDGRARRLLELHYTGGASREAIATEFRMGENGVKAFLRRVRSLLRDCVLRRQRRESGGVA
jgi:RNA polymerase sigma factor (sigma-70 family)